MSERRSLRSIGARAVDRSAQARPEPRTAAARSALRHLEADLVVLEQQGLLRLPQGAASSECLVLCSNDYLGYARLPLAEDRAGSGASRLISGDCSVHAVAESALAGWTGCEAALLFSSGYAANVGALSALAGPEDVIVSDALNHASIIDGCRLSRARVAVVPHLDLDGVRDALRSARTARRRWVVTESYFSMDGDRPDLVGLRAICDEADAGLIVDEAHALGVIGAKGAGASAAEGIRPDVLIGTLGKALGLQGAFVAGSEQLRLWLWNRARSFVFSTGISPAVAATVIDRVDRAIADEGGRDRLRRHSAWLRAGLQELGIALGGTPDLPILPWRVGSNRAAVDLASALRQRGVLVQAIRPPTVPVGTARLRLTVSAGLTASELERAARVIRDVARATQGS